MSIAHVYAAAAHDLKRKITVENYKLRCEDALSSRRSMPSVKRNQTWQGKLQNSQGVLIEDVDEIRELAAKYYEQLYTGQGTRVPPKWYTKRWDPEAVKPFLQKLTPFRLRELTMKLKTGKTCSKSDRLTAEM